MNLFEKSVLACVLFATGVLSSIPATSFANSPQGQEEGRTQLSKTDPDLRAAQLQKMGIEIAMGIHQALNQSIFFDSNKAYWQDENGEKYTLDEWKAVAAQMGDSTDLLHLERLDLPTIVEKGEAFHAYLSRSIGRMHAKLNKISGFQAEDTAVVTSSLLNTLKSWQASADLFGMTQEALSGHSFSSASRFTEALFPVLYDYAYLIWQKAHREALLNPDDPIAGHSLWPFQGIHINEWGVLMGDLSNPKEVVLLRGRFVPDTVIMDRVCKMVFQKMKKASP